MNQTWLSDKRNTTDGPFQEDCGRPTNGNILTNMSTSVKALALAILLLSLLFTAVGNGLVLVIIAKIRRLRTAANLTIVNLASYDFVVGTTFGFVIIPRCTMLQCAFFMGFVYTILQGSMLGIGLCTLNRYVAIAHPLRYKVLMSPERTCWLITSCLLYSVAVGSAAAIQISHYWQPSLGCLADFILPFHFMAFIIGHYVALFIFMIYCYVAIARIASDHARRIGGESDEERREMSAFRETMTMTKIILTVVGTSWVLLGPHVLSLLLMHILPWWQLRVLRAIRSNTLILNSLLNPIIYFYKYKDYRLGVRELFGCPMPDIQQH
ncbi:PREDICTED: histamine H2 receptor-like [Priapulus caudatus]|uniref:Histamine H2 receptor-like n=1 Tax=Priapulus caudatus TaxID=37621 RepID=A0ABM1ERY2_PRICU|nr:PREDICTED: histamine H2 receptor-like [Priapulus caudatus]